MLASIAFPLWNTNALTGLLWARLLFGELKGARPATIAKVVVGAVCVVLAAILLGFKHLHNRSLEAHRITEGIVSACGASLLWGTMYVPYRKAYLSGMNPLSFVTVFTVGELLTMVALASDQWRSARNIRRPFSGRSLFVLALSRRLCLGHRGSVSAVRCKVSWHRQRDSSDQQNQLWGLAWGALVLANSPVQAGNKISSSPEGRF